jgi:hypothetical protein
MSLFDPFTSAYKRSQRAVATVQHGVFGYKTIARFARGCVAFAFNRKARMNAKIWEAHEYFAHHEKPLEQREQWQNCRNAYQDMQARDDFLRRKLRTVAAVLGVFFAWDLFSNLAIVPARIGALGLPADWEVQLDRLIHSAGDSASRAVAAQSLAKGMGFFEAYWPLVLIGGFLCVMLMGLGASFFGANPKEWAAARTRHETSWWMRNKMVSFGISATGHFSMFCARVVNATLVAGMAFPSLSRWRIARAAGRSEGSVARLALETLKAFKTVNPIVFLKNIKDGGSMVNTLKHGRSFDDTQAEALWRAVFGGRASGAPTVAEIKAEAELRWPAKDHPTARLSNLPPELQRPMVVYGRLADGSEPVELLTAAVSPRTGAQAMRIGVATFLAYMAAGFVAYAPNLYFNPARWPGISGWLAEWQAGRIEAGVGIGHAEAVRLAASQIDGVSSSFFVSHGWMTAAAFAVFMGMLAMRRRFAAALSTLPACAAQEAAAGKGPLYYEDTHEQHTIYGKLKERIKEDGRNMAISAARIKNYDTSPVINIGYSSGELLNMGVLGAPVRGTPVGLSLIDLQQNFVGFGATGSGKTKLVLTPILEQLLDMRQDFKLEAQKHSLSALNMGAFEAPDFYKQDISFLIMDGKADLFPLIQSMASAKRQSRDFKVIGLLAHECVIDLLDGLPPQLVAAFLKSMASQMGASSTESFWPDQAALFIERAARVAEAFDLSDGGLAWRAEKKVRPYSLRFIYDLLQDMTGALLVHCTKSIIHCIETDPERLIGKGIDMDILMGAIRELHNKWINDPAETTRSNIQSNIDNMLKPITSNADIANTFAAGNGPTGGFMKVKDIWGHIVATNIKNSDGAGGAMVLTFIKTLFMYEALKRQGDLSKRRLQIERRFMRQDWFMRSLFSVLNPLCSNEVEKRQDRLDEIRRKNRYNKKDTRIKALESDLKLFDALPSLAAGFSEAFFVAHRVATEKAEALAAMHAIEMPNNFNSTMEYLLMLIGVLRAADEKARQGAMLPEQAAEARLTEEESRIFNAYESRLLGKGAGAALLRARALAEQRFEILRTRRWDDRFDSMGEDGLDELSVFDWAGGKGIEGAASSMAIRDLPSNIVNREVEGVRSYYETPEDRLSALIDVIAKLDEKAHSVGGGGFSDADAAALSLSTEERGVFSAYRTSVAHGAGEPSLSDLVKFSFMDVMRAHGGEEAFTKNLEGNAEMLALYYEWRDIVGPKGGHDRLTRERVFFICDEHQQIVTVDSSGTQQYTDSGFWNVSRSAGVGGLIFTQTISAYLNKIKDQNAVNGMLDSFRTKICLPSTDQELVKMFKEFAPKANREKVRTGSRNEALNTDLTFAERIRERQEVPGNKEFSIHGVPVFELRAEEERLNDSWKLGDAFAPTPSLEDLKRDLRRRGLIVSAKENLADYSRHIGQVHTTYNGGSRQSNEDTINSQRNDAEKSMIENYNGYLKAEIEEEDAFDASLFSGKSEGRMTVMIMRGNRQIFDYVDVTA